jgi:nitrous oxide reductase accessory protein NosL
MSSRVVLPWFLVVLLAGCGKSQETSRPTPVSTSEPAQGEKTDAAPATEQPGVAGSSEAAVNAALGELTQALRKYSFEHQRLPKTISEVVAAGYVKNIPQAPHGKKFVIDAKTVQVVLANQ